MKRFMYGEDIKINGTKFKTMIIDYGGSKQYLVFESKFSKSFNAACTVNDLIDNMSFKLRFMSRKSILHVKEVLASEIKETKPPVRVTDISPEAELHFFNLLNR